MTDVTHDDTHDLISAERAALSASGWERTEETANPHVMAATGRAVREFLEALSQLESGDGADALAKVFAEGADIGNVVSARTFTGPEGAKEFWTRYRQSFGELQSAFRAVIIGPWRAALEWTSTGTSADGAPIHYDGVSVLEIEGDSGKISRFRAYFDPAHLGHQMQRDEDHQR